MERVTFVNTSVKVRLCIQVLKPHAVYQSPLFLLAHIIDLELLLCFIYCCLVFKFIIFPSSCLCFMLRLGIGFL